MDQDLEELIETGAAALESIGILWESLEDIHIKQRFQKWLFPARVVYDAENFGTTQLPLCISIKKDLPNGKSLMVDPRRLELLTPSMPWKCSTN